MVHPGLPDTRPEHWTNTTGPFLLCTGSEDPICSPDGLLAFARTLQEAGVDWRVNVYGRAQHAFWATPTNSDGTPTGENTHRNATVPGVGYHPAHTTRAWRAVLDLLDETIGAQPVSA